MTLDIMLKVPTSKGGWLIVVHAGNENKFVSVVVRPRLKVMKWMVRILGNIFGNKSFQIVRSGLLL